MRWGKKECSEGVNGPLDMLLLLTTDFIINWVKHQTVVHEKLARISVRCYVSVA